MNGGNGGNVAGSREIDLAVYDKLPKNVRAILQQTTLNVASVNVDMIKRKYHLDSAELEEELTERVSQFKKAWIADAWHSWCKGKHPNYPD